MSTTALPHTAKIQFVYDAFGRGDVPSILGACTDDTRWHVNAKGDLDLPWWGTFKGKAEVGRFFQGLAEHLDFFVFEPTAMVAQGNDVVVRMRVEVGSKKTGRKVQMEEVHWWTLNDAGLITGMTLFEDSAQVQEAMR